MRRIYAAALAMALAAGAHLTSGLQAQTSGAGIPDLSGIWTRDGRATVPAELPLNARGIALQQAVDESLAPMYDCVPATIPHILGDPYNFAIEQQADRVLIRFEKDAVVRTVWLEGHGHPAATPLDYAVQGHSTGRYEGSQLVVETTKFTFDPAGLEDKPPMVPSSTQKKVVERYAVREGRLIAEVTMEDPLIMTEPVNFRFEFRRTDAPLVEWPECDPEQSRAPLNYLPVDQLKYGIR
jgi:hypothetical protein